MQLLSEEGTGKVRLSLCERVETARIQKMNIIIDEWRRPMSASPSLALLVPWWCYGMVVLSMDVLNNANIHGHPVGSTVLYV